MQSNDKDKIIQQIITMINTIMVEVENYFTHSSLTKLEGGFKMKITGLHVWTVNIII